MTITRKFNSFIYSQFQLHRKTNTAIHLKLHCLVTNLSYILGYGTIFFSHFITYWFAQNNKCILHIYHIYV